jgi:hypothetical protein
MIAPTTRANARSGRSTAITTNGDASPSHASPNRDDPTNRDADPNRDPDATSIDKLRRRQTGRTHASNC